MNFTVEDLEPGGVVLHQEMYMWLILKVDRSKEERALVTVLCGDGEILVESIRANEAWASERWELFP